VLKRIWRDSVWSEVIAAAIVAMGAFFYTYFVGWWPYFVEWWAYRATIASEVGSIAVSLTPVPNWLLVPICLSAAFGVFVLLAVLYRGITGPDWHDYRQDTFFGIVWRWDYARDNIIPPIAFCPSCDTQMSPGPDPRNPHHPNRIVYHCGHCDNRITINDSHINTLNKVVLQIDRKIRQMGR
jgi:hypothetical protein